MSYIDSDKAFFTIAGRTLYADSSKTGGFTNTDAGLTLAKDAPVIVYQASKKVDSNGTAIKNDFVYDNYANLETALKALKGEGKDFVGYVSAVLNTKGTAQYIVISDTAGVDTVIDDGTTVTPSGYTATVAVATRTVTLKYPAAGPMDWDKAKTAVYNALYEAGYEVVTFDLTNGVLSVTSATNIKTGTTGIAFTVTGVGV